MIDYMHGVYTYCINHHTMLNICMLKNWREEERKQTPTKNCTKKKAAILWEQGKIGVFFFVEI